LFDCGLVLIGRIGCGDCDDSRGGSGVVVVVVVVVVERKRVLVVIRRFVLEAGGVMDGSAVDCLLVKGTYGLLSDFGGVVVDLVSELVNL